MKMTKTTAEEIVSFKNVSSIFPMVANEYLNKDVKGDCYYDDAFEWWEITDDTLKSEEAQKTVVGLMCTTENRITLPKYQKLDNSLHISVLEVAEPVRGYGIGTEIMDYIIDIAMECNYQAITLMLHEPSLANFYKKFGFKPIDIEGVEFYVLYI